MATSYFSLAIRSAVMRSRASVILEITYWAAMYPTPNMPALIAKLVLFRRSQRLVADIIVVGSDASL